MKKRKISCNFNFNFETLNTMRYTFVFLFFLSFFSQGQNLDSLYQEAKKIRNDSLKLDTYNQVAFKAIFSEPNKAIKIILEGKQIAKEKSLDYGLVLLTNTQGIYMDVTGQSDSAKSYFEKALKISQDFSFNDLEARCTNNLGMFNWNKGNYEEALAYFFKALEMDEIAGRDEATANPLNNIGLIYSDMGLNDKALEYHRKAYEIRNKYKLIDAQISSLNNIGIILYEQNKLDDAIKTYKQGIDLAKQKNNLQEHFLLLENLGNVYNQKNDFRLAIKSYLETLEVAKEFSANEFRLWSVYNNLAVSFNEINQPKRSLVYLKKGLNIVKQYPKIKTKAAELFLTAAETNYMLNDFKKARSYKQQFVVLKDSIFSEQNAKAMANMDVKYETQKKEREILQQRTEIAEQDLIIQRRNYQIYAVLGVALVFGLLGYLFYNQQKLKNIQLQKEAELKDALLKIETQNKLQEQRLRISRDLHDNIGAQLTFITSSIDNMKYGFDLPNKVEAKLTSISSFTNDTIYELRDTIWAMNKDVITFEDLQVRISNFINKANLSSQNIHFNFHVEDELNQNKTFTSIEGMNIYRIVQESINNALKYANATEINVSTKEKSNKLQISVFDNGKGFDIKNIERGNGLNNMKKRADEINAYLNISSNKENGTNIQLIV